MKCSTLSCISLKGTTTTESYTLSLHDALPISERVRPVEHDEAQLLLRRDFEAVPQRRRVRVEAAARVLDVEHERVDAGDRKSTRLNSSHSQISYAVFCLKKKIVHGRRLRISIC